MKIAVELQQAIREKQRNGHEGNATARLLDAGEGWRVVDVLCTSGPDDRPFEERHEKVSISIVAAGTFQYRTTRHAEFMSPGSFLLGHPNLAYECAHEHGTGDRCISFQFSAEAFERITQTRPLFRPQRLPPLRDSAPLAARACAALARGQASWEELAVAVAARTVQLANGVMLEQQRAPLHAAARVTRAIRLLERRPAVSLQSLSKDAGLSPYHFLRTFTQLTGTTPHQFAMRARLREAAVQLTADRDRIIDVALDCGFGDVSNFNRAFRAEFGVSPRRFKKEMLRSPSKHSGA
ncbi:MAG TPA: AraC family transcriptional regulator [Thermoanaerobaculia bacterium]|nr:AraC family transcriptional regulator [Thermoanaerobaculia bacterium]